MKIILAMGLLSFILSAIAAAQVADAPDDIKAGIPVNYTEAKVGTYTLPDPLKLENGQPVTDADTWFNQRRPEIIRLYEEDQYGRAPGRPGDMSWNVFDTGTPAFGGKAIRKQITIYFSADKSGPQMDLLLYLPADAGKAVPVLLCANFFANNLAVDDPGVKVGRRWDLKTKARVPATMPARVFGHLNVPNVIGHGYGIATVNYADIDPDAPGAIMQGVRALYLKPGQTEPAADEWGTIAAWAWGLSRAMDYLQTDPGVDPNRVGLFGVSRLGKTVLWATANDPRFSLVIASCSGEGGAKISRRNYGETVKHMVARYSYQFCANYAKFADDPNTLPVDGNMLISLIAPRPVLLQTGNTDRWSDPKGEFLAAVAAGPVYRLLGKDGLDTDTMPDANQPILHDIGYFMHVGPHGSLPSDWDQYFAFMQMHWKQ
ncbi:MAG TPA: hypothetical protein VL992_17200 [Tepidisphaeraceae bacterium]|nr:hypothetical protein [Tepidisphaeraceae bacterium]